MLYEKHIPELKEGQTIKIKRPVNNAATKEFVLKMFKTRAYYRLKDFKNPKVRMNNNCGNAEVRGKLEIKIGIDKDNVCYQEECFASFL